MRGLFPGLDDRTGNLEPRDSIYPNQMAPWAEAAGLQRPLAGGLLELS